MLRPFPCYPACPVCGDRTVNPGSLEVRWSWDDARSRAIGTFVPGTEHTGYAGVLHGGLLTALLDECMAWACAVDRRAYCMTGDLTVRFRSPARLGEALEIGAWTVASWGPYVRARGEAVAASGVPVATATATFAALSRQESWALQAALRLSPGDVDVLAGDAAGSGPGSSLPQTQGKL